MTSTTPLDELRDIILREVDSVEIPPATKANEDITLTLKLEPLMTALLAWVNDEKEKAYRKGYNDNARDCYCDSPGATEGVIPHHHLMDDGKSYKILPDIAKLNQPKGE
jgi:hypothetical protein